LRAGAPFAGVARARPAAFAAFVTFGCFATLALAVLVGTAFRAVGLLALAGLETLGALFWADFGGARRVAAVVLAWAATAFFRAFVAGFDERAARVVLAALLPAFAAAFLAGARFRAAADPDLRIAVFLRAAVVLARAAGFFRTADFVRTADLPFAAALPDFDPDFFAGITDSCPVIRGAPDYSHRTVGVQQSNPAFGRLLRKADQIRGLGLLDRSFP
jgi:hypothetical protein